MGCVSSSLLNQDGDEFGQIGIGSNALSHHIVSLTSTTYGLLTLDPPTTTTTTTTPPTPPKPPHRYTTTTTLSSLFPYSPLSESKAIRSEPEVINSWELMAGLDTDSFRFSPLPSLSSSTTKPSTPKFFFSSKPKPKPKPTIVPHLDLENSDPNRAPSVLKPLLLTHTPTAAELCVNKYSLDDGFQKVCPPIPNGENKVVLYTTTLRGVRQTFEACNAVRSVLQGLGFQFCERDISMDRGFRDELNHLLLSLRREKKSPPPHLFIKGRYVGGAEEVLRIHEEGGLTHLLQGLPKLKPGLVCDGCGGVRFLPCFQCHGSCKLVMLVKPTDFNNNKQQLQGSSSVVITRCPDCNENGLVLCPICS